MDEHDLIDFRRHVDWRINALHDKIDLMLGTLTRLESERRSRT